MALLQDMIGGKLGSRLNGGDRSGNRRGKPFERTLNISDFFTSDQSSLPADKYSQLGTYTIPAQQQAEVGQGDPSLDPMEQGRPNIDLENTSSTDQEGFVKVTHENATGNQVATVFERRTEELRQSTRSERIVTPRATTKQGVPLLGQDDQIGLYFKPDSSGTVGNDESTMELPVTLYEL